MPTKPRLWPCRGDIIPLYTIAGTPVSIKKEAKCLGYWWQSNLGADKSVEANIEKGRKAFFAAGAIGAYQGSLNPLSARSIFLTCVISALLYGCEKFRICVTKASIRMNPQSY